MQQFFFGRQFALRLGRNLADEDIARHHESAGANDPAFVEIAEGLGRNVGNVARELLPAQLGLADFDIELLDMDRSVGIVLDKTFADDDGIFKVITVPRHERDEDVAPQRQLAMMRGGAVGHDESLLDLLPHLYEWLLVQAGALVQADELAQHMLARAELGAGLVEDRFLFLLAGRRCFGQLLRADDDTVGIDVGYVAIAEGLDQHAGVLGDFLFQPGRNQGRLRDHERHRLPLHVGTHEGAVGVIMFQEGD